jgi:hypothetical protein
MASSRKLDEITRILDLIAAPLALEILDGIGKGSTPQETAPPGTDPAVVAAAIESLRTAGVVVISPASGPRSPVLTPVGRRLLAAFERADDLDHQDARLPNA